MTSHEEDKVRNGTAVRNSNFKMEYSLIRDDQTHPYGSKPSDEKGDLGVKTNAIKYPGNENAIFRILFQGK